MSKIPFRDYCWVGPFIFHKVLPNENFIVRRLNTNKTQLLQRIRLKQLGPNPPLEDSYREEKLQSDEEIIIPQDDLFTITLETNFGDQKREAMSPSRLIGRMTKSRLRQTANLVTQTRFKSII